MKSLALALLLAVPAAHAQMYKCTEGGKTRYSDKPITDCKSTSTIKAPPPPAASSKSRKPSPPQSKLVRPPEPKGDKKGAKPGPEQKAKAPPPTEHDKKYANAQCRELREEEAWLQGPRGAKVENRDARLGQVRQALFGCR
jgi:hypothetical protein